MHFSAQNRYKLILLTLVLASNLFSLGPLHAQEVCGPLAPPGQFGPFDYTSPEGRENLPVVENYHFGAAVQSLRHLGEGTGQEIDYTLRAFPNHHRALERMAEFSIRIKSPKPPGAKYDIHCYFDRALRMKPDDGIVYMLFGNYLSRLDKNKEALEKYQEAVRLLPDNGNINYNVGLFYFNQKDFELSYQHAKKAYDAGFPLPGLKNKLQKAGKWREA